MWIKGVDRQMKREKRNILKFLDNATSHAKDIKREAEIPSRQMPLNQGIIRAFKARYLSKMMKSLVAEIDRVDNVTELCKQISVLDDLFWIRDAWSETRPDTIQKCFALSGFCKTDAREDDNDDDEEGDDDIPLAKLMRITKTADMDKDTLLTFDDNIPVEDDGEEWERSLVTKHLCTNEDAADDDSEEESCAQTTDEPAVTLKEISEFSRRLRQFAVLKDDRFLDIAHDLRVLSEDAMVDTIAS
ncbi:tigger transposable element-derived protein 6-like [Argopecten irradians]|uniref:tigger transposable element-derived protein 6-like n=1 Tax=Argopecten irradians TaxID=31199 RepID=UPI003712D839